MRRRTDTQRDGLELRGLYSVAALARIANASRFMLTRLLRADSVQFIVAGQARHLPLVEIEQVRRREQEETDLESRETSTGELANRQSLLEMSTDKFSRRHLLFFRSTEQFSRRHSLLSLSTDKLVGRHSHLSRSTGSIVRRHSLLFRSTGEFIRRH